MTLLRQLVIVIVTLFLLLFAGTLLLSISNTRDYLNQQLRTITQDTATSLGLSLTPPMTENDMVVVDSMVSAVSDSGYYREVVVSDVEGKPLITRKQEVKLAACPTRFYYKNNSTVFSSIWHNCSSNRNNRNRICENDSDFSETF